MASRQEKFQHLSDKFLQPYLTDEGFSHYFMATGSTFDSSRYVETTNCNDVNFFDLASLTKVLVTLPLLSFYGFGGKDRNLNLKTILNFNPTPFPESILQLKINDLISHRAGLPAWKNFWVGHLPLETFDFVDNRSMIFKKLNVFFEQKTLIPGPFVYSDVGYICLGLLLEICSGEDLASLFSVFCKKYLNIQDHLDLNFSPHIVVKSAVPTSYCLLRDRRLVGDVHDENAAVMGGISGHAGLFGTGNALVRFFVELMNSKVGQHIVQECENLYEASHDVQMPLFGWMQYPYGFLKQKPMLAHFGFTGCSIFYFPLSGEYQMILTNRVKSGRRSNWVHDFRKKSCELLCAFNQD